MFCETTKQDSFEIIGPPQEDQALNSKCVSFQKPSIVGNPKCCIEHAESSSDKDTDHEEPKKWIQTML